MLKCRFQADNRGIGIVVSLFIMIILLSGCTRNKADIIPPSNPIVIINRGDTLTKSVTIKLRLSAVDNIGIKGYCIKENFTEPAGSDPCWRLIPASSFAEEDVLFTLSEEKGTKTLYVWFMDTSGNISASATDSIELIANSDQLEDLGILVRRPSFYGSILGKDKNNMETLYLLFGQSNENLFLLAFDPVLNKFAQYNYFSDQWKLSIPLAKTVADNGIIYIGTNNRGYLLKFEPTFPEKGIVNLGRPSYSASYIWDLCTGTDGKIYGGTSPDAAFFSYDPETGIIKTYKYIVNDDQYVREVETDTLSGMIYLGIGYTTARIFQFNPVTEEFKNILPEEYQVSGERPYLYTGTDLKIYAYVNKTYLRIENGETSRIDAFEFPGVAPTVFSDGREVVKADYEKLILSNSQQDLLETHYMEYDAEGTLIWTLYKGTDGSIWGGTALPNRLFNYDPFTEKTTDLGNATYEEGDDGQIYSIVNNDNGNLYIAAYPGSFLSYYDPREPWNFGYEAGNNPRAFGRLGDGHLRPYAMVIGPEGLIYIGSSPEYGKIGGALAIFDPERWQLLFNYENLIPGQSIFSLSTNQHDSFIYGGTIIGGDGISAPEGDSATFFIFDTIFRKVIYKTGLDENCLAIKVYKYNNDFLLHCQKKDNINSLFLFKTDLKEKKKIVGDLSFFVFDLNAKNNKMYGYDSNNFYEIDLSDLSINKLYTYNEDVISSPILYDYKTIYFSSGSMLRRYNIQ